MTDLFTPIKIGSIEAKNRIIMAPLTRGRATADGVPTEMMQTYYSLRADAGLIVTEATGISRTGLGWAYAPGIYSDEQVEHWKPIVKAVHDKGGKIISQLWHMGRATHSNVIGTTPVSASATTYPAQVHTFDGKKDPEQAHALTVEEIKDIVQDYKKAAKNAIAAGFDGVQIHAANGYLLDQFLRDSTNLRTDQYGGSIENRIRFLGEVVDAVIEAVGAERTNVRLSPNGDSQGVIDSDPEPLFTAVAELLEQKHVASIALRQNHPNGTFWGGTDQPQLDGPIRKAYKGILILNQEFTRESADKTINSGKADAVSFGRNFIPNPDLVAKLRNNVPVRVFDDQVKWWYSQGPEGYIDFPIDYPEGAAAATTA